MEDFLVEGSKSEFQRSLGGTKGVDDKGRRLGIRENTVKNCIEMLIKEVGGKVR